MQQMISSRSAGIAPTDVRDYAKLRGWRLIPELTAKRLLVMSHPEFGKAQIVLPIDSEAPDYYDALDLAIDKLSSQEGRPFGTILSDLKTGNEDTLQLRLTSGRELDEVPFEFATQVLWGTRQLLLASAQSVIRPQRYYKRLGRGEPQRLISHFNFRHTESGSFVFKVSCPLDAAGDSMSLNDRDSNNSFTRKTTLKLDQSLSGLISAIETDALPSFVNELQNSGQPMLSANFCDALSIFENERVSSGIELSISWASSHPVSGSYNSMVHKIDKAYFTKIRELSSSLTIQETARIDGFVGTVEELRGDIGEDGKRAGEVIVSLLTPEGDTVNATIILDAPQYEIADQAHMKDDYVYFYGRLHPGRQPKRVTELKDFERLPLENYERDEIDDQSVPGSKNGTDLPF